ncbi:uncharacterized protein ISCGN_007040 [Ixodes scapularis]
MYYWPKLPKTVHLYTLSCHECQRRKKPPTKPAGVLQPIAPPSAPFQQIGMDLLGPFRDGLLSSDYLTRYAETKALPAGTAVEVAKFFIESIILRHGAPEVLISDRGSSFMAQLTQEILRLSHTNHRRTTAYHPQINGLTERLNKTILLEKRGQKGAKKPAPLVPLADITFHKYLVNRPVKQMERRSFDPCENVGVASAKEIKQLRDALSVATPGLQWLLYSGVQQLKPVAPVLPIQDDEDLWSKNAQNVVGKHIKSLPTLTGEEREEVTRSTIGQANNARWHKERQGRITASVFSAVIKCVKPEYLVKGILYPSRDASSEAMRYGRTHEGTAVPAYASLMEAFDIPVEIRETGLHIHPECSFIPASPDRIVMKDNEECVLEVKCPASKIGLTPMEGCKDKTFCCEVVDGLVQLKKTHAYFYQVQGQMAVTGYQWCDFVFWTNNKTVAN